MLPATAPFYMGIAAGWAVLVSAYIHHTGVRTASDTRSDAGGPLHEKLSVLLVYADAIFLRTRMLLRCAGVPWLLSCRASSCKPAQLKAR